MLITDYGLGIACTVGASESHHRGALVQCLPTRGQPGGLQLCWDDWMVRTEPIGELRQRALRRRGFLLEFITLGWNIVGVMVLAFLAIASTSIALVGFGLDSLIEIGASTVVLWELSGTGETRQRRALRLIGAAFIALALYLLVESTVALVTGHHAAPSIGGVVWTAVTAGVMFSLAAGKSRTGRELGNPVLVTESRVTFVDGLLAVAVLLGITLDLTLKWWWADPIAGYVIVYYAIREAVEIFRPAHH